MPLPRRFILASVVAAVATLVLFVAGWLAAPPLLGQIASSLGLTRLYFSSPGEPLVARLGIAAAFALPPVVAWVALLLHRLRHGADASAATTLVYAGVPVAAVAGGMALRVLWLRAAMRDLPAPGAGGLHSLFLAPDLSPHAWGLEAGLLAGFVLCLAIWLRAPRR